MIVGKVMEEPEDQMFSRRNVTVFDEAVKIGEDNTQNDDQQGPDEVDQHGLSDLLISQSWVI